MSNNKNIEYTFDDSILTQSIQNEVSSDVINNNSNNNFNSDSNNNYSNNQTNDNSQIDALNYDIDRAIMQEIEEGISKDYNTNTNNNLENNIKELEDSVRNTQNNNSDTSVNNNTDDTKSVGEASNNDELDPYNLAFDIIREENLLYIPEDFEGELDADAIDYFKQYTKEVEKYNIINSQRNKYLNDPVKLRMFDYFFSAEEDADLPLFDQLNSDLDYWENYDISNEDNQKEIIKEYLKAGLNPDNPSYSLLLSDIDSKVNSILENYEGEDKAKEARDYFLKNVKENMTKELQRVNTEKEYRLKQEEEMERKRTEWNNNLIKAIQSKNWNNSKKNSLINEQYQEILYENEYVPMWYAKEDIIKSNPDLYVTYLDWLNSNFDIETKSFKTQTNSNSSNKKEVTRKIMEIIQKKQGISKSHQMDYNSNNSSSDDNIVVNPMDML